MALETAVLTKRHNTLWPEHFSHTYITLAQPTPIWPLPLGCLTATSFLLPFKLTTPCRILPQFPWPMVLPMSIISEVSRGWLVMGHVIICPCTHNASFRLFIVRGFSNAKTSFFAWNDKNSYKFHYLKHIFRSSEFCNSMKLRKHMELLFRVCSNSPLKH